MDQKRRVAARSRPLRATIANRVRGREPQNVVPIARRRRRGAAVDDAAARLRIRMYRVGLGDCFLLTFHPKTEGEAHLLVDMGSIGQGDGASMADVAADIAKETSGKLKAIVATHEHADHLSGFTELARHGVAAEEIWLAWTEDISDPLAQKVEKYRGDLLSATAAVADNVRRAAEEGAPGMSVLRDAVREAMSFHGLREGDVLAASAGLKKRLNQMMAAATDLAGQRTFCSPGDVLERSWAPGVHFYVLGPPRDPGMLQKLGDHGSPDLYEIARAARVGPGPRGGTRDLEERDSWRPFDNEFLVKRESLGSLGEEYARRSWRQIDDAGLGAAADLALQLDNCTNNTSLVLAIEVGDAVMLFPGDAQLGSWLTWGEVSFRIRDGGVAIPVTGSDLLRRTVFYKVGHHASHNATATTAGLELMGARGLTAFVPLDKKVADKKGWSMPASKLEERLLQKTRGRLFRSDIADEAAPGVVPSRLCVDFTWPSGGAAEEPAAVKNAG
jgi:hypothetical protein